MLFQQKSFCNDKKTLYLIATPIGNLADITLRALSILKEADLILSEDTRVSNKLLYHYQIKTPLLSFYEHNQIKRIKQVLQMLFEGKNIALISDAGTPLISDPGFSLVCEAQSHGFNVVAIPGVSAFLTAFMTSALQSPFLFLGFLPRLSHSLSQFLLQYANTSATLIAYESPYRIKKTLFLIHQLYGNRKISLARELTKKFETIINGDIEEVLKQDLIMKGEYVLLIEGNSRQNHHLCQMTLTNHMLFYLKLGFSQKESLIKVAQDRKIPKKEVYRQYKINNTFI